MLQEPSVEVRGASMEGLDWLGCGWVMPVVECYRGLAVCQAWCWAPDTCYCSESSHSEL